ncbi:MAG: NAD(P)H-quinone oxidoreductase [Thermoanaerobaculia bacterium]
MRAILVEGAGPGAVLQLGETDDPVPGPREVLIDVRATSVNRADILQKEGRYPPPPGASRILGLECAGTVERVGEEVRDFAAGDRVMALLSGGGYAEKASVDAGSVIRVPDLLSDEEAGAFPETFLTAFLNIFLLGEVRRGATVLIHGGGSGVGTSAIQLCREEGVRVLVTVGSPEKAKRCVEAGAEVAINYKEESFAEVVREATRGEGVDMILDHIGAEYLEPNLASLAIGGRLVVIGGMGGRRGEVDLGRLLARRLKVIGSTLRSRPPEEKRQIVKAFLGQFGVPLREGRLRPIVDSIFPLAEAEAAHQRMLSSQHFGKIVLRVGT